MNDREVKELEEAVEQIWEIATVKFGLDPFPVSGCTEKVSEFDRDNRMEFGRPRRRADQQSSKANYDSFNCSFRGLWSPFIADHFSSSNFSPFQVNLWRIFLVFGARTRIVLPFRGNTNSQSPFPSATHRSYSR